MLDAVAALGAALVALAGSAPCTMADTVPGIGQLSQQRIELLVITTHAPRSFGGVARVLDRLHTRTQPSRIARELLFAEGDSVDSPRIAESLRRVRALPFIYSARIASSRCREGNGVALLVDVVDSWSTVPEGRYTMAEQSLGFHEANLRGRGQALSAVMRWELDPDGVTYRVGGGVSFADAAATSALGFTAGAAKFADGRRIAATVATRSRSAADLWIGSMQARTSTQEPVRIGAQRYRRDRVELLAGRRVTAAEAAGPAFYLQFGVVTERTALHAANDAAVTGPRDVVRRFTGAEFGAARRATRFDTLTWVLPNGGIVDAPRGLETDIVMSVGHDAAAGATAIGYDAWAGTVLQVGTRTLASLDMWSSGYRPRGAAGAAPSVVRGSVEVVRGASRGLWRVRASSVALAHPDPDVGPSLGFDAALPFLPPLARRASRSTTVMAERTAALRDVSRSLVLDAALFASWSMRRALPAGGAQPRDPTAVDPFAIALAGAGLRLTPTRQGVPTVRLDLAIPIHRASGVAASPRVIVTLLPSFGSGRRRSSPLGI